MLFESYTFFALILLLTAFYNVFKGFIKNPWVRNSFLLAINLLVLLHFIKEHSFIVISILGLLVYVIALGAKRKRSVGLISFGIILVVSLFIIRNFPLIQDVLNGSILAFTVAPVLSVQKLGISYILFRMVHFLVESFKQKIQHSDPLTFLNYLFFFPTFLAGPIDTYTNFHYFIRQPARGYFRSLALAGLTRIVAGAFKTIILSASLLPYAVDWQTLHTGLGFMADLSSSLVLYSLYIYLNFSGYSDIAIGTAYLLGIKTPENFNNPYCSSSLSQFWKTWHITFSMFLKLYVFKPVLNVLNKLLPKASRLSITMTGYLFTFTVCGLWHGSTLNFIYWGLWHGAGLALNKYWTTLNSTHHLIKPGWAYTGFSIILTFIFVTFGWMFFNYNHDQLLIIFSKLLTHNA
jgi:alginate O-acetyltransferase complex protein AlgI